MLGQPPSRAHMEQYLEAYFGGELPSEAVQAVVGEEGGGHCTNALGTALQSVQDVEKTDSKLMRF